MRYFLLLITLPINLVAFSQYTFLKRADIPQGYRSISPTIGLENDSGQFLVHYNLYQGLGNYNAVFGRYTSSGELLSANPSMVGFNSYKVGNSFLSIKNSSSNGAFGLYNINEKLIWKTDYKDNPTIEYLSSYNDSILFAVLRFSEYKIAIVDTYIFDTTKTKNLSVLLSEFNLNQTAPIDIVESKNEVVLLSYDFITKDHYVSIFNKDLSILNNLHLTEDAFEVNLFKTQSSTLIAMTSSDRKVTTIFQVEGDSIIEKYSIEIPQKMRLLNIEEGLDRYYLILSLNSLDNNAQYSEIGVYTKDFIKIKTLRYRVPNQDIILRMSLVSEGGYFFVGTCTSLFPEDNAFIMKTDSNGFVDDLSLFPLQIDTSSVNTSISTLRNTFNISYSLYPNPTSTQFTIQTNSKKQIQYSLYSLNGQIVETGNFVSQTQIDVSEFTKGVYLLHLQSDEGVEVKKFLVR